MIKKITLFFALVAVSSLGFSQALPFDFEGTLHGFIQDGGAVISNGTGNDVLEIVGATSDWDNAQVTFASQIDLTDNANNTLRFTIQSTTAAPGEVHQHGISFQGGGAAIEINFQTTGQEVKNVELNFETGLGLRDKMVIFTDTGNFGTQSGTGGQSGNPTGGMSGTYIIDNMSLGADPVPTCSDGIQNQDETGIDCGGVCPDTCPETCSDGIMNQDETGIDCGGVCSPCPAPPASAAPTPPNRPAADVISLYSDAYTDVASNFDAAWCGANSWSEEMIAGNPTAAYLGNACQGIVLDAGVDATTFTRLHVDVYIQAGTDVTSSVFNLKFVQQPGGAAVEVLLNAASTPPLIAGSWISVDVPVDLSIMTGFKEFGITSNLNNEVWYDNLYAHKGTTLSVDDNALSRFRAYPNPTQDSWTIKSGNNTQIKSIEVFDILGKTIQSLTPNSSEAMIDSANLRAGLYLAKVKTANGLQSLRLVKN